ncbi:MAG TPA: siderophore-interacting protein, partial [Mycobacteriales bacterium]|nr:siderophore-interacting protein [Mycobacteriales bacterium]
TTETRPRRRKPMPDLRFTDATVRRVADITPHLRRITLHGEGFAHICDDGPDQRIKLFFPPAGHERPQLPGGPDWYPQWQQMPDDVRPIMRTYTARALRPEDLEADVDFVLHGDSGPASRWALRAQPGDHVGFFGCYAEYDPPAECDWQLIVGDETAIPAISCILERMPSGCRAQVLIEVGGTNDEVILQSGADAQIHWVHRGDQPAGRNQVMLDAVRDTEFPLGRPYAWLGGESGMVTSLRRHLVNERDFTKDSVCFLGYWKYGRAEN